jgi:phosphoribosylanthranilate isomerase
MWIKICGITRLEDALSAARFGADAVGFVFAESPRQVTPERAREISRLMPAGPARVGVFMDMPPSEVSRIADFCALDLIQLHGDEDADYCEALGDRVIKAVRVRESIDLLKTGTYPCQAILLDGYYSSKRDECSRSANRVHWKMIRVIKPGRPVIIAGGLNPDNVAKVIKDTVPYGVDVSSGVESAPGVKDPVLMYKFIEKARKADYEVNEN